MITPYKGPYPCPTCGQGEPEPLDEMQRLGQEFDAVTVKPDLDKLLAEARAKVDAMTPKERAEMYEAQRESWVRGEMALGPENGRVERVASEPMPTLDELLEGVEDNLLNQPNVEHYVEAVRQARDNISGLKAELAAKDKLIRDLVAASCAIQDWYNSYKERCPSAYWFCMPYQLGEDLENILARAKEAGYA